MNNHQNKKRNYKKITPRVIALHEAQEYISGNGTQAVINTDPDYISPKDRAHRIAKKSETMNASEYIENSLQQIAGNAIQVVAGLVLSEDERIATKNAHFVIEHIRGKAVQRNINANVKLNIQSVLD